jgi:hypothetical protein
MRTRALKLPDTDSASDNVRVRYRFQVVLKFFGNQIASLKKLCGFCEALTKASGGRAERAAEGPVLGPVMCCMAFVRSNEGDEGMRKLLISGAAVVGLAMAGPALADEAGGFLSMQQALAVASDVGIMRVSETQFSDHEWQIEGRDVAGRYMEVDVDAATGEVVNVDR